MSRTKCLDPHQPHGPVIIENKHSCYDTCIGEPSEGGTCTAAVDPAHNKTVYSHHDSHVASFRAIIMMNRRTGVLLVEGSVPENC